ncbi:hypothetical protein CCR97_00240 [Rhodoplanes elegans]|uniref:Uncharacterized protein n=1 Tax=Rhodoplanes elegans TaxID=29408 RepID=A0A327K1L9_9BRAD|nr:hypothetical protein [Rhodoplanes elegans]MBK5956667.1 hypothetical protein [Rhodoplanes elegans]RAI32151.1 hypothetical protein CH338_24685 [Rhodoplanes elegans]
MRLARRGRLEQQHASPLAMKQTVETSRQRTPECLEHTLHLRQHPRRRPHATGDQCALVLSEVSTAAMSIFLDRFHMTSLNHAADRTATPVSKRALAGALDDGYIKMDDVLVALSSTRS